MSLDFRDKICCVIDHGMNPHVAIRLAEHFKEVLYWTDWSCAFPTPEPLLVGEGFPGVKRMKYFWKECSHADLFVVCDIYHGDLQHELVRQGKRVFGPRWGERLEICRWETKKLLPTIGLPEPPGVLITGISELRKYLKDHKDKWVKVSGLRGLWETYHHINYALSEFDLDSLERLTSGVKEKINYVVDDPIPLPEEEEGKPTVEVGYDGYAIDDKFPEVASFGYELKDCGLVSRIMPWNEFPDVIRHTMNCFRPVTQDYGYRGFCCAELRVNKDGVYMTDWAARPGSPSSEALMKVYKNWPEMMWFGAEGRLIKPEQIANYSIEVVMHAAHSSSEDWKVVQIEDEARPWVMLHLWARDGSKDLICPQEFPLKELGCVVGIGDTLEEAVAHVKKNCEGVTAAAFECKVDSIEKGLEEIKKGEQFGIDFGETVEIEEAA